jgi:hypothetical protein
MIKLDAFVGEMTVTLKNPAQTLALLSILLVALLVGGCGTLEIGIVRYAEEARAADPLAVVVSTAEGNGPLIAPQTPTPVPADWVPPTPEPASTPMSANDYKLPGGLRVAFINDGNVCLWAAETKDARRLTNAGDIAPPLKLSDDGELVAFVRDGALWALASDGGGERRLLNLDDLSTAEAADVDATLTHFEWVPGTHTLAFNTRLHGDASRLADDLHLVDADNLEHTVLLPRGEGGEFFFSPDGSRVAIVTTGDISLVDVDDPQRRSIALTYAPVAMNQVDDYYARPTWSADGSSLIVAIPPADPHSWPIAPTTIWRIFVDGDAPEYVTGITAVAAAGAVFFSHDLQIAAFPEINSADVGQVGVPTAELRLLRLSNGDWFGSGDAYFLGWAPNTLRFAMVVGREVPYLRVGQWSGPALRGPIDAGIPVQDFRWVDDDSFLVGARRDWEQGASGDSWDLVLGNVDGASIVLVQGAPESVVYDVAQASTETSDEAVLALAAPCATAETSSTETANK